MSTEVRRSELRAEQLRSELATAERTAELHASGIKRRKGELDHRVREYKAMESRVLKELKSNEVRGRSKALEQVLKRASITERNLQSESKVIFTLENVQSGVNGRVRELSRKLECLEQAIVSRKIERVRNRSEQLSDEIQEIASIKPADWLGNCDSDLASQAEMNGELAPPQPISPEVTRELSTAQSLAPESQNIPKSALNSAFGAETQIAIEYQVAASSAIPQPRPGQNSSTLNNEAEVKLWSSTHEQGLELKIDNLSLLVREGGHGAIEVELSGRGERERRGLWAARREIEQELKESDVKLRSIKVLRHG